MAAHLFADVILPLPIPGLFTYSVPALLADQVQIGSRVIVSFGKKKVLTGIVANIHATPPQNYTVKEIIECMEAEPLVTERQISLWNWMADYYMCTIGDVMNAALPSGFKLNSESQIRLNSHFNNPTLPFSEKEQLLISKLHTKEYITYDEAGKLLLVKSAGSIIKSLLLKERILVTEQVKDKYTPLTIKRIKLSEAYIDETKLEELLTTLKKKAKQRFVIEKYFELKKEANSIEKSKLLAEIPSASALQTLIKNGILEETIETISRINFDDDNSINEIVLTSEQQKAKEEIVEHFKLKEAVLLHGITGSGKTEVFIELIKNALAGGSQVLYLLPEIALTTQIVSRLKKVFGGKMGVYHSRFTENERVEVWQGLLSERFSFVVGVRSSVFLPFTNLGLVIIDEEHETSYKQYDPAPRYHARDTALVLARMHHAKTLLGSATPAIESYYNTEQGKWGLVRLDKRFGEASLPDTVLVDLKRERKFKTMRNEFSEVLLNELKSNEEKQEQSILFQNRRGFSPLLMCEDCSYVPKCNNCAVSLTYHLYSNELRCHYCGHCEDAPVACPECGSAKIKTLGFGTEKIEDSLKLFLPDANIARMDLDTTRKKNSYQDIIERFENREIDVLIGTQMVSKGLDFDRVSLVGVLDADKMLHFSDFRSYERTFQMLTQVSGRAGRKDIKGKVIIQTSEPEHPLFAKIIKNNYQAFYNEEIHERRKYHYPPFYRLIKLTVKEPNKTTVEEAANYLAGQLIKTLGKNRILGPETPVINKIRNYFINEIYIKLERDKVNSKAVKDQVLKEIKTLLSMQKFKNALVAPDVDPI